MGLCDPPWRNLQHPERPTNLLNWTSSPRVHVFVKDTDIFLWSAVQGLKHSEHKAVASEVITIGPGDEPFLSYQQFQSLGDRDRMSRSEGHHWPHKLEASLRQLHETLAQGSNEELLLLLLRSSAVVIVKMRTKNFRQDKDSRKGTFIIWSTIFPLILTGFQKTREMPSAGVFSPRTVLFGWILALLTTSSV